MLSVAVEVTDDRWNVGAQLAKAFDLTAMGLSVEQALATPQLLIGTVDQLVEGLQERRERYGISYVIVFAWQGESQMIW